MDKKQHSIVIYGGSFDPVHKGHTVIIKNLVNHFDKVIVMPAFMSPHKKDHGYTAPNHRFKMLELALEEEDLLQKSELSSYELDKQTTSYTIETIQHIKTMYPNARLYFCIGSECLSVVNQWKDFEKINTLVTFFVVPRPNFTLLIPPNLNAVIAPFAGLDTSSSLIKALIALNEYHLINQHSRLPDINLHLSSAVLDYIRNQNLYPLHQKIGKLYHKFDFNKKRIPHIIGTIKLAIHLAKLYNVDPHKASLAALLHDIAKYATFVHVKNEKLNIDLNNLHPVIYHAKIGEVITRQLLKIDDADILNSIKFHTTKRADMSSLEKITSLADYLEENRAFDEIEKMREMLYIDLDECMKLIIIDIMNKLESKKKDIYYLTKDAYEFYVSTKVIDN